ncbi:hypothetical protein AMTRI_Chr08g207320 [Amborella trichopoda]|uniref:Homeobox domain-containing protein n=1 Tax=Amborella trichopoda TaxID=13333 RepID=W1NJL1_AMBTC|nr:WUSCHEL-related homeobox 3 [Amborella trichopoda]ERM95646.1 hypothetical protein AMTR_s00023p00181320 [Amborella trichopoda]|eukprot:XP_006828230.1 WUSCHEL-related homeobox 3 [Amborella trichopoda]
MPQAVSTRWCPTAEQLMILEEMYRGGIRTPNALQIQHITTHLSYYGKIEGKNVFYWFQNHKARDRQKLRRKMIKQQQQLPTPQHEAASFSLTQIPPRFYEEQCRSIGFMCMLPKPEVEAPTAQMDSAPRYRALETLDLFPVRSTGIKEEKPRSTALHVSTSSS